MSQAGSIILFVVELLVFLVCIFLGSAVGGVGIGFMGAIGVAIFGFGFQMVPGNIPFDVIQIILAVICAISAMQVAGGLDYVVHLATRLLKSKPAAITFLGPMVTYSMTILAGTSHTAYASLPIIAEVAKESGIRPSRPLSISVVASQIAICASPISAAIVWLTNTFEDNPSYNVGYTHILAVLIPSTLIGTLLTATLCTFIGTPLYKDQTFLTRAANGACKLKQPLPPEVQKVVDDLRAEQMIEHSLANELSKDAAGTVILAGRQSLDHANAQHATARQRLDSNRRSSTSYQLSPHESESLFPGLPAAKEYSGEIKKSDDERASVVFNVEGTAAGAHTFPRRSKLSVIIFLGFILAIVTYSLCLSNSVISSWPTDKKKVSRNEAIVSLMLSCAAVISYFCKVNPGDILKSSTFLAGVSGCICVLGVAWMGNTFISHNLDNIKRVAGSAMQGQPWIFPIICFVTGALLYSQASTAAAIYPIGFQLGVGGRVLVASFPAVAALFVLPTYPTLLAAVALDDTGTTTTGKYVFDHSFIIAGFVGVVSSILIAFGIAAAVIRT